MLTARHVWCHQCKQSPQSIILLRMKSSASASDDKYSLIVLILTERLVVSMMCASSEKEHEKWLCLKRTGVRKSLKEVIFRTKYCSHI